MDDLTLFMCVCFSCSIYNVHDDAKDKEFELELSWVCEETKGLHQFVPKDIAAEAEQLAKVRRRKSLGVY